jgi:NAD+ synthase
MEIDLTINPISVREILIDFLHTGITRTGLNHAVVNLSGGLDSAVSCVLTARALGPENVLALRLPYKSSSKDSLDDAQLVIDLTGVHSITIPITPMVEPLIESDPDMSPIRKGNIMARIRMIVAYDRSADFKAIVVGTGNKTEVLLGYTTLYGDSACGINPLGDLYKTQVRQLARSIGIPEQIISKPPSADLWAGQTDEGELGYTYADVDKLLYLLVERSFRPEDCVQAGFQEAFVRQVIERILKNEYKRLLPPIARLSNRTVGYDSLELHDWGM